MVRVLPKILFLYLKSLWNALLLVEATVLHLCIHHILPYSRGKHVVLSLVLFDTIRRDIGHRFFIFMSINYLLVITGTTMEISF